MNCNYSIQRSVVVFASISVKLLFYKDYKIHILTI